MRPLLKLTWVEVKLFFREPLTVVFTFAFPLVLLFVLAGVFGNEQGHDQSFHGAGGTDFYIPSYLAIAVAAIGLIGLPTHLATYRERGILRRLRASSVSVRTVFVAEAAVGFVLAVISALILIAATWLAYHPRVPHDSARVLLGFVIAVLCAVALGLCLSGILKTGGSAQAAGLIIFFPAWLLSGAGPPPAVMPSAMRHLADLLPVTYMVRAVQDPWIGFGAGTSDLAVLAAIAVAATALSLLLYRAAEP
jgi:ABC-2 type transport system permease protein